MQRDEKKAPRIDLIERLTRFWQKSEPLLRSTQSIWDSLPSRAFDSDKKLVFVVDNLRGLPVDRMIASQLRHSYGDRGLDAAMGLPPIRFKLKEIADAGSNVIYLK